MSIVDLASTQLEWLEASVSGAELPVQMYPLHVDLVRGTRTLLVEYPDGWARSAAGTQPAGEAFLTLSGALTMTGVRAEVGQVLVTTPRALRTSTSVEGTTRAVVFFSGPGGGWEDGDASASGSVTAYPLEEGFLREETGGLVGRLELWHEVPQDESLANDAEIVWLDAHRYGFVPRGGILPEIEGRALVRLLN